MAKDNVLYLKLSPCKQCNRFKDEAPHCFDKCSTIQEINVVTQMLPIDKGNEPEHVNGLPVAHEDEKDIFDERDTYLQ
jgi:hypothetical protein